MDSLTQCWFMVGRSVDDLRWVSYVGPTGVDEKHYIGPTQDCQRWPYVGPMSEITFGKRLFFLLCWANMHVQPWANVGPTYSCYLGIKAVWCSINELDYKKVWICLTAVTKKRETINFLKSTNMDVVKKKMVIQTLWFFFYSQVFDIMSCIRSSIPWCIFNLISNVTRICSINCPNQYTADIAWPS